MTEEVIRKNVQGKQNADAKELELKTASSDFDTALNVCRTKAKEYRQAMNRTGYVELSVVTVGIIAGSIVVPALAAKAAAKSTVAAWGGVSGAANGYQYAATQEGLSAAQYSTALTVMTTKMSVAMNEYNNSDSDPAKARVAVGKMIMACEFPSPAELEAATPPSPPYAPKDAVFERGSNGNGTIKITPPDKSGGANITDYIATITPAGPVLGPADFRNSSMPTISVTSIDDSKKYQVLIRAQNRVGTSGGTILEIPVKQ